MLRPLLAAFLAALTASAAAALPDPYPSTYRPIAANPVLIRNTTIVTGSGNRLDNADLLLVDGRINGIGKDVSAPDGDPLAVTTLADQVWMSGRPMSMTSRQTELRDRYLAPPGALPRAYSGN